MTISNPSTGVTIGAGTASATIADNDGVTANLAVTQAGAENNAGTPTGIVYTVDLGAVN